ncbi:MAG: hypothetical protein ABIA66_04225 [Candidatus Omnitrophota bacterium]
MQETKVYHKPKIIRIKLNAGESIMGDCQSTSERNILIKRDAVKTCRMAGGTACRNAIS